MLAATLAHTFLPLRGRTCQGVASPSFSWNPHAPYRAAWTSMHTPQYDCMDLIPSFPANLSSIVDRQPKAEPNKRSPPPLSSPCRCMHALLKRPKLCCVSALVTCPQSLSYSIDFVHAYAFSTLVATTPAVRSTACLSLCCAWYAPEPGEGPCHCMA